MRNRFGGIACMLAALGALFLAGGCGTSPASQSVTATAQAPEMRQRSAESLGIVLDANGRPYDVTNQSAWEDTNIEIELIGDSFAPGGQIRVLDGNALQVSPSFFADDAASVDFGTNEHLELSLIWESGRNEGHQWQSILGVRLDVDGGGVEQWQPFELGYGTDGGIGGLTTKQVLEIDPPDGEYLFEWNGNTDFYFGDHDEVSGDETFVWFNGYGDGSFPMSRGLGSAGQLVSLIVWDTRYPWRLAVLDGRPPQEVTQREDQLLECMNGTRPVDQRDSCLEDPA